MGSQDDYFAACSFTWVAGPFTVYTFNYFTFDHNYRMIRNEQYLKPSPVFGFQPPSTVTAPIDAFCASYAAALVARTTRASWLALWSTDPAKQSAIRLDAPGGGTPAIGRLAIQSQALTFLTSIVYAAITNVYYTANVYQAACEVSSYNDDAVATKSIVSVSLENLTSCSSWCNVHTCDSDQWQCLQCQSCTDLFSGNLCADWCNSYTCGNNICAGCAVCNSADACYPWCNAYTCALFGCSQCNVCSQVLTGTYCASWCNSYTCHFGSFCSGCSTCSPS